MPRFRILAPWSRAPLQLRRQPVVAVALAVAALLITVPASAAALFLSSAGNATLRQLADTSCTWIAGMHITAPLPAEPPAPGAPRGPGLVEARADIITSHTDGLPHLTEPVVTLTGQGQITGARHPDRSTLQIFARDGFADHVRVLAGGTGRGVWLPDGFARLQQLEVGERVTLTTSGSEVSLPVAAIYRDLRSVPDTEFWCSLRQSIRGNLFSSGATYPVALVSRADFLAAHRNTDSVMYVERGVNTAGLTTESIRPTVRALQHLPGAITRESRPHDIWPEFVGTRSELATSIGGQLNRAELVVAALSGTVVPLTVAGIVAGLVIAAAGGAFWADRRRRELAVLSIRGVGGAALSGKAVLESVLPAAAGTVAGWFGARALLGLWGPSPHVTDAALSASMASAGGAFVATIATIAVVGGMRAARRADPPRPRRRRRRGVPWELALIAAGIASWFLLNADVQVETAELTGRVARIPPPLVVTPALLVAGFATLCARLAFLALARWHGRASPRGLATGLAFRRVVAAPLAAAILIGATAVPVALSLYGETVTRSAQRTIDAEAALIVGTDAVFQVEGDGPVPDSLDNRATLVTRYHGAQLAGTNVEVLGVDPATFARVAFWDDHLPGPPLTELTADLGTADRAVGLVVGLPDVSGRHSLEFRDRSLSLEVRSVEQLPGKSPSYPLVLVSRDVLVEIVPEATNELWLRGDPDEAAAVAERAGFDTTAAEYARDVHAAGIYAGITYTFTFLAALSTLTGVVVVVGVLLYLDARSRSGRGAYVLLRRMGVGAGAHRRALLLEVGGLLLAGFVLGAALAAAAVWFTAPGFDLDPATSPDTLIDVPWLLAVVLGAATAVTAGLGAVAAQRVVSSGRPSEVLRDTE